MSPLRSSARLPLLLCVLMAPDVAQAQVSVQLTLPSIRWPAPPRLVVLEPGVQIVEDSNDEVFYQDGFYWSRSGERWFRTADHRGGWVVVAPPEVPPRLTQFPPGRFIHYRSAAAPNRVPPRWHRRADHRVERYVRKVERRTARQPAQVRSRPGRGDAGHGPPPPGKADRKRR